MSGNPVPVVGNFGGFLVRSDKRLKGFDGETVTFTDGSSFNVRSEDLRNVGDGALLVDRMEASSRKPTAIAKHQFSGVKNLQFRNVACPLTVLVDDTKSETVRVEIMGGERVAGRVTLQQRGTSLIIDAEKAATPLLTAGHDLVSVTLGGVKHRNPLRTIASQLLGAVDGLYRGESLTEIRVYVSRRTELEILRSNGRLMIGDTLGNVLLNDVTLIESGTIGEVGNLTLYIKGGSGTLSVASVCGDLLVDIVDDGNIHVNGGKIDSLSVEGVGKGEILVEPSVRTVRVRLRGSMKVETGPISDPPDVQCATGCTFHSRTV